VTESKIRPFKVIFGVGPWDREKKQQSSSIGKANILFMNGRETAKLRPGNAPYFSQCFGNY
jgi:hypothetical protein